VRKPTAAAVAREAALPKLGAGQGRYLSVIKLTDSDIYLTSAGKEWHVMDVDIDGGHVVVQMMNEDQTATVKFSADEMVRVL
jgi:hypothetical protein